jgi:NAD(P)-dependent dehydrogenase (short-subunit alcohol dehydrogenase family)
MYGQYNGLIGMSIALGSPKGKSPQTKSHAMTTHTNAMSQHIYIITGASKGMGLEMARQLLKPTHQVLCLSRTASPELAQAADVAGVSLVQWCENLADPAPVAQRLDAWLASKKHDRWASVTLINNAGTLGAMAPLQTIAPATIAQAITVDLIAPLQLTAAFLQANEGWPSVQKVLNISSGMSQRAMAGAALYGAAKAGMDHFSRCVALDEERRSPGARIVSLAPGVIDTDMQKELRNGHAELFPDKARYIQLQATGALTSPSEAARQVLAYLHHPEFGSESVVNIVHKREMLQ